MAGFTTQKGGFIYISDLFLSICQDLSANGFSLKYPSTLPTAGASGAATAGFKATLEFTETDATAATMPWRIMFDSSVDKVGDIYVATPIQLPNDGTYAVGSTATGQEVPMPVGMLNTMYKMPAASDTSDQTPYHFLYRKPTTAQGTAGTPTAYPMSYRIVVTNRGLAICVWTDADDADSTPTVSWLTIQRPVDNATGAMFVTGHAPVFCVYGAAGNTSKFVVREADVYKPTPSVPADSNTEDSRAILNTANQVSITEDNRYVITFPNGLNTPRYSYTQELDMLAYTSADVVSQYTNVPLTVYGEGSQRIYKAMPSLHGNSTGMRLLFLIQGGGAANAP